MCAMAKRYNLVNSSKLIILLIILSLGLVISKYVSAGYRGQLQVTAIHGSDLVYFGTNIQPIGTCSFWGRYFVIDTRYNAGKTMMSMLLVAQSTKARIDVWYTKSPVPNTDQATGCTPDNVSKLTNIGLPLQ
jgi:hypothetical protein